MRTRRRVSQTTALPSGYAPLLADLKVRVRAAQVRAVLSVNRELVLLYWQIGRDILRCQRDEGWGAKVVERLAKDLRTEFPEMHGFSRANLLSMRAFAGAYSEERIVQQLVGQLPWGHNVLLLTKVKNAEQRLWYARRTLEHGWSRAVLAVQIETNANAREGMALTNFKPTLPPPQSDPNPRLRTLGVSPGVKASEGWEGVDRCFAFQVPRA